MSIYDLVLLGFEVIEDFEEDKEANKDLEDNLSLSVYVNEENIFVLTIVKKINIAGLSNPVYHYSEPYEFSTVEELKDWMTNTLPNLEVEFVN
jgi:hypothetical protein